MNAPFAVREQIAKLVRLHGLPIWALKKSNPQKKVMEASLVVDTKLLTILAKADVLGRINPEQKEKLLCIELFAELCKENDCFGKPRHFDSAYGRFLYFNKVGNAPDYVPYDDLKLDVYMMCALPGSGKDAYIKNNLDLPVLSLDDLRRAHKVDPRDKKRNGRIIQMGKEKAKEYLRSGQSFVFNATNITKDIRGRWISLFTLYKARVKIIYIEVPYQRLLSQNHDRDYKVPEKVIHSLIGKLEMPSPTEAHEVRYEVGVS